MLFYPFEYQDRTVDWDTLKKLSWATQDEVAALEAHNSRRIDVQKKNKGEKNRKNFVKPVKIRQTDVARLQPGGWLNDTLIDFWCLWYVSSSCTPKYAVSENDRHNGMSANSKLHCAMLQGKAKRPCF